MGGLAVSFAFISYIAHFFLERRYVTNNKLKEELKPFKDHMDSTEKLAHKVNNIDQKLELFQRDYAGDAKLLAEQMKNVNKTLERIEVDVKDLKKEL